MAKNIKITGVSPNRTYTKKYETFRGVDFSKDASMVDDFHSPHAPNIIADSGGFPEKRLGWRTVGRFDARINGIFGFGDGENACTIVHSGTKIYRLCGGECEELLDGIADNISTAKYFKGKLCILTGNELRIIKLYSIKAYGIIKPAKGEFQWITLLSGSFWQVQSWCPW